MENLTKLRIAHLAEQMESIPMLARWALLEWGHLSPGITHEQLVDKFKARATPGVIPETLVAMAGDGHAVVDLPRKRNTRHRCQEVELELAALYVHLH